MKLSLIRIASIWVLLSLLGHRTARAQELNCIVQIQAPNLSTLDQRIRDEMQSAFTQFMNDQIWTEDQFETEERINCILNITVTQVTNQTVYSANVQIQASRPVYGTSYETLVLRYFDQDWTFEYNPGQALNFNPNNYTNDITALLSFYAYIILGMDYDSFSPLGGDPHFQQAWAIVNQAQSNSRPGWDQFANNGRNRYQFTNLMANGQMSAYREGWYTYHLKGMDRFLEDDEAARQAILEAIQGWAEANRSRPNTIVNQVVMDTKSDELMKVFSEGEPAVRQQASQLLTQLDPTNTSGYEEMLKN